jgi:hypothetical protein
MICTCTTIHLIHFKTFKTFKTSENSLVFPPKAAKHVLNLTKILKTGDVFFFPNYPPKTAKYLLIFFIHNKKKKTFWTLDFRKKWIFWIFGFLDFWIFAYVDYFENKNNINIIRYTYT